MDIEFPEWQGRGKTAPLRLFTYDIETTLRPPPEIGQDIPFPHPGLNVEYDQVAQIGCTITLCQCTWVLSRAGLRFLTPLVC